MESNPGQYGGIAYGPPDQYQQPHPHHQRFPCPPPGGPHQPPQPGGPPQPPPQYAQQYPHAVASTAPGGPSTPPGPPGGPPNTMMHSNINQRQPHPPPHFIQRGPPGPPGGGILVRGPPVRTGFRNPGPSYRAVMRPQQPPYGGPPQQFAGHYRQQSQQPQDWQRPQQPLSQPQQPPQLVSVQPQQPQVNQQVSQADQQSQDTQLAQCTMADNTKPNIAESQQIIYSTSTTTTTSSSTRLTTASVASNEDFGQTLPASSPAPSASGSMSSQSHDFGQTLPTSVEKEKVVPVPWGWMRTTLSDQVIYKRYCKLFFLFAA